MKREDDQELWDLLGEARSTAPLSPFFARNVLRQIRAAERAPKNVFHWLSPRVLIPASAVALAVLVMRVPMQSPTADSPDNPPATVASIDPQDYDTVLDLDDLLTTDDDGLWNDNDSSSL